MYKLLQEIKKMSIKSDTVIMFQEVFNTSEPEITGQMTESITHKETISFSDILITLYSSIKPLTLTRLHMEMYSHTHCRVNMIRSSSQQTSVVFSHFNAWIWFAHFSFETEDIA